MSDVPPPTTNFQTPPTDPASAVSGPALFLMIVGGLGILGGIAGILMRLLGIGLAAAGGGGDRGLQMLSGGLGIVFSIVGIIIWAVVLFGGMKMKKLQSYGLAMTAAILAMLPCSFCCILGLPAGIWALVILMKPEVKAAFTK